MQPRTALKAALAGFFALAAVLSLRELRSIRHLSEDRLSLEAADLAVKLGAYLDAPPYSQIRRAIDDGLPLILKDGVTGRFTESDLERYLKVYDVLWALYDQGLMPESLLWANFSIDIVRAYQNRELQDFIASQRQTDAHFADGLQNLGTLFSEQQSS